jgi:hypothetical protein
MIEPFVNMGYIIKIFDVTNYDTPNDYKTYQYLVKLFYKIVLF